MQWVCMCACLYLLISVPWWCSLSLFLNGFDTSMNPLVYSYIGHGNLQAGHGARNMGGREKWDEERSSEEHGSERQNIFLSASVNSPIVRISGCWLVHNAFQGSISLESFKNKKDSRHCPPPTHTHTYLLTSPLLHTPDLYNSSQV